MSTELHDKQDMSASTSRLRTDVRRPWILALAAIVVVVSVAALAVGLTRTGSTGGTATAASAQPASPLTGVSYTTSRFRPAFTWNPPLWTSGRGVIVSDTAPDLGWKMSEPCDPRCEWLGFVVPRSVNKPGTGQVLPISTATQYLDYIHWLGTVGPVVIKAEKPVSIDGITGTEIIFDERQFTPGAFLCTDTAGKDCYVISEDMTTTAVVLDVKGTPLVASTSALSISPDVERNRQQFEQALTTIKIR